MKYVKILPKEKIKGFPRKKNTNETTMIKRNNENWTLEEGETV